MLNWGEIYCLGIEEIDAQHADFFAIAEKAEKLVDTFDTNGYKGIQEIIRDLQKFASTHFTAEEEFMRTIAYHHLIEHKMEHSLFSAQITNIDFEVIHANEKEYLLKTLDFIVQWIILHIANADTKLSKYYHEVYNK